MNKSIKIFTTLLLALATMPVFGMVRLSTCEQQIKTCFNEIISGHSNSCTNITNGRYKGVDTDEMYDEYKKEVGPYVLDVNNRNRARNIKRIQDKWENKFVEKYCSEETHSENIAAGTNSKTQQEQLINLGPGEENEIVSTDNSGNPTVNAKKTKGVKSGECRDSYFGKGTYNANGECIIDGCTDEKNYKFNEDKKKCESRITANNRDKRTEKINNEFNQAFDDITAAFESAVIKIKTDCEKDTKKEFNDGKCVDKKG